MSLVLPFVCLFSVVRAHAQIQAQPSWAVVPFVNKSSGGGNYGPIASQAIYEELSKLGKYDLRPPDEVNRTITTLGLQTPVTDDTSLLRLSNELRVSTIVTGEVVGWGVQSVAGGKQAEVGIRVLVRDVASGLGINGAAIDAKSSVRSANTPVETLVSEAIDQASAQAVATIQSQVLPNATILNTRNNVGDV